MKKLLKRILPRKVIDLLVVLFVFLKLKKEKNQKKSKLFLLQTPVHQNLGDHAIAYAELELFKDLGVVEITDYQLNILLKFPKIIKSLIKDDVIMITGGGNLGTIWFDMEQVVRKVLTLFNNNRIFILPQTVYYSDDDFGKQEYENFVEICNNCKSLTICTREKASYDFIKKFHDDVLLVPDMVLYINKSSTDMVRSGVMTFLRDDHEKSTDSKLTSDVVDFLSKQYSSVENGDMISNHKISVKMRKSELDSKFMQFKSKEFIVTDRLHGMIFSAITGTPCIVLAGNSRKIIGVYDWILKNCEYIIYTDNMEEIENFIKIISNKKYFYDNSNFIKYFLELKELIKKEVYDER